MKKQINTSQSNKSFSTKGSRIFVVLVFALILLIIPNNNSYSMSFFNKEKSPQGTINNPYQLPVSVPIDITRKGNKLEFYVEVKEERKYFFELQFPNQHRGFYAKTMSILYQSYFTSWILMVTPTPTINKEERNDFNLTKTTPTPTHITVVKIEDKKEITIIDKTIEPKLDAWGKNFDKVFEDIDFNKSHVDFGVYRISVEAIKDSPEFVGKKIHFGIKRSTENGRYKEEF